MASVSLGNVPIMLSEAETPLNPETTHHPLPSGGVVKGVSLKSLKSKKSLKK